VAAPSVHSKRATEMERTDMTNSLIARPKLIVIHDNRDLPGECLPGEEVITILLVYLGRRYRIPWGPTHLILADFLCRYRWISLDAWQIAEKMANDPFVQQHGMNASGYHGRPARTSRTSVRQQIKRMREVLAELILEHELNLNAWNVLRSEKTSSATVRYRITLDVTWEHLPRLDEGETNGATAIRPIHPGLLGSAKHALPEVQ